MFDEHAFPAKSSEIDLVMKFICNYFKMFDQHTTYVRLYLSSLSSYFGAACSSPFVEIHWNNFFGTEQRFDCSANHILYILPSIVLQVMNEKVCIQCMSLEKGVGWLQRASGAYNYTALLSVQNCGALSHSSNLLNHQLQIKTHHFGFEYDEFTSNIQMLTQN